jgi:hypothetical protein
MEVWKPLPAGLYFASIRPGPHYYLAGHRDVSNADEGEMLPPDMRDLKEWAFQWCTSATRKTAWAPDPVLDCLAAQRPQSQKHSFKYHPMASSPGAPPLEICCGHLEQSCRRPAVPPVQ